jgi:hypothetical protein
MDTIDEIQLDKEKARELCIYVIDACNEKKKLFSNPKILENMHPENKIIETIKSREKNGEIAKEKIVRWLFFACSTMQRVLSEKYFAQVSKFYRKNSAFLDNENLERIFKFKRSEKNSELYRVYLNNIENNISKNINMANSQESINYWIGNAITLSKKLEGKNNFYEMLREHKDVNSLLKELREYKGFGIKQSKMYVLFLIRYGLLDFDVSKVGPTIDSHFINISSACNVLKFKDGLRVDKARYCLDKLYQEVTSENKLDFCVIDSGFWIIGNNLCLKKDPLKCQQLCPLDSICTKEIPNVNKEDTRLYKKKENKMRQQVLQLYE